MTDTPTVVLEDEYEQAARELLDILAQEKALADRKAECKRILEKALAIGERGISADGEPLVAVRAGATRFDPDLATQQLSPDTLALISVTAPDAKRAKQVLGDALYELCCTRNKPSVVPA
jgi:hypothetical protein